MPEGVEGREPPGGAPGAALGVPVVLLLLLGIAVWASALTGEGDGSPVDHAVADLLRPPEPGQLSGLEAAEAAVALARGVVDNSRPNHDGLFAGPIESVLVRYEPSTATPGWTILLRGPVRSRPNTGEEFTVEDGMVVIELSAVSAVVTGNFAAGRAFSSPDGAEFGFLRSIGVRQGGFSALSPELFQSERPGLP